MSSKQGLVIHNVCALRAEPRGGSEQTSQLIMGDSVRVLDSREGYVHVCGVDDYTGWAYSPHIRALAPNETHSTDAAVSSVRLVTAAFADFLAPDRHTLVTRLVLGAPVTVRAETSSDANADLLPVTLPSGSEGFVRRTDLEPCAASTSFEDRICLYARRFMGTPYVWGGTTSFGIDCSGLVQRVYRMAGMILPRDAYLMASCPHGQEILTGDKRSAGDLIFFRGPHDPRNRGITHVGLLLDESTMIHAYGRAGVTINRLDDLEIRTEYTVRAVRRFRPVISPTA